MTRLVLPDVALGPSLRETVAEFGDPKAIEGSGWWRMDPDFSEAGLPGLVAELLRLRDADAAEAEGLVASDSLWITDGDPDAATEDRGQVIGFLSLRHRLNEFLYDQGGHIGYAIRPSRRREGHAGRALALALERAKQLGIERALVTCDHDNVASRRTIEGNGGELEDRRGDKLRFWIPTSVV